MIVDKELWGVYQTLVDVDETVDPCNVKRNADLIANIMDADAKGMEYIRPISYYDCAHSLLKMWMDDILTDSEYYRIIDKLNANRKEEE